MTQTPPAPDQAPPQPQQPTLPPSTRPARWKRVLPPLLAGGLVAVLGLLLLRPAPQAAAGGPLLGRPAPDFSLPSLAGPTVTLSSYRGRPVVLNFWASWCGPCREEAPLFADLNGRRGGPQGVQIIGILFQETSEANARAFIKTFGLNYSNVKDATVDTGIAYGLLGIPQTVFIDGGGVVRYVDRGGLNRERLNVGLEKIGVPGL